MNKWLKLELLICLIISFFIPFYSSINGITLGYINLISILEIFVVAICCLLINKNLKELVKTDKFDIVIVGLYTLFLVAIVIYGFLSPSINEVVINLSGVKRVMYFHYSSHIIFIPTLFLLAYILIVFVRKPNGKFFKKKKKQKEL